MPPLDLANPPESLDQEGLRIWHGAGQHLLDSGILLEQLHKTMFTHYCEMGSWVLQRTQEIEEREAALRDGTGERRYVEQELKLIRKTRSMAEERQRDLADEFGLTPGSLQRILRAQAEPGLDFF